MSSPALQPGPGTMPIPARSLVLIGPESVGRSYLREAWAYRELLWFFARRDLLVRYRQTALGVAWVVVRPLLAMGVFAVLFGTVAKLPSFGTPYPLLVLAGMLPWQFVASVLSEGALSVAGNSSLVTKIYFPRILMPTSGILLNAVDLVVNLAFFALVMAWFQVIPGWQVVLLPLPLAWIAMLALGATLWLSALMVFYRDVRSVVPVVLQFGLLATPVAWSSHALPDQLRWWAWLNPLAVPVETVRWCLLPGMPVPGFEAQILAAALSALVLGSGYRFFRQAEARFADVI